MNESLPWLKMLAEVAAEEAAIRAVHAGDAAFYGTAGAMCGKEGSRAFNKQRSDLIRRAGA